MREQSSLIQEEKPNGNAAIRVASSAMVLKFFILAGFEMADIPGMSNVAPNFLLF
jgi:hypothetical protein